MNNKQKLSRASQKIVDKAFVEACQNEDLDLIRYLLTSNRIKNKANIHFNDDEGFRYSCIKGDLRVTKYLLSSNELSDHANIHANNDEGFKLAFMYGHLNILEYFIFELNIEKNEAIQEHLELTHPHNKDMYPSEKVRNMFILRDHQRLEKTLPSDKINQKKLKL